MSNVGKMAIATLLFCSFVYLSFTPADKNDRNDICIDCAKYKGRSGSVRFITAQGVYSDDCADLEEACLKYNGLGFGAWGWTTGPCK